MKRVIRKPDVTYPEISLRLYHDVNSGDVYKYIGQADEEKHKVVSTNNPDLFDVWVWYKNQE